MLEFAVELHTSICSAHITLNIELCRSTDCGLKKACWWNSCCDLALLGFGKAAPVPYQWQSQSPSAASEPSCQTPAGSCDAAYMWMSCHSGAKTKRTEKRKRPSTHTYSPKISIKTILPRSGMTLTNAPCFWPNIPVSAPLCNWLRSRVSAAGQ